MIFLCSEWAGYFLVAAFFLAAGFVADFGVAAFFTALVLRGWRAWVSPLALVRAADSRDLRTFTTSTFQRLQAPSRMNGASLMSMAQSIIRHRRSSTVSWVSLRFLGSGRVPL